MSSRTDEDRWVEAQSLLDRVPTEAAEQRFRRRRRNVWLQVVAVLVAATAIALLLAFVLIDRGTLGEHTDVPTWQAVVGFSLSGIGLVWAVVALVAQVRGTRRVGGYRSALFVLTRRQRRSCSSRLGAVRL